MRIYCTSLETRPRKSAFSRPGLEANTVRAQKGVLHIAINALKVYKHIASNDE